MAIALFNMKSYTVIVLLALLVFSALSTRQTVAYSAEETAIDTGEVLNFLRDVVELDMTKYNSILLTKATNYWPWLGGVAQTTGQYSLDSTGFVDSTGKCGKSLLTVTFSFWDNKLISCDIYEESQGPPLYSKQPPTDLKDAISALLQRYQTYSGDAQLSQMRSLLDMVEITSNTTKKADNLSLEVECSYDNTCLKWGNTLNGADYSRLILEFQNGHFESFADDRSFYKLGSSEVNISQEEAESIALKSVEPYQYTKDEQTANFNIIEKNIRSRFSFLNRTNHFILYPCWIVDLPLSEFYAGGVSYIEVMLWADSGEVISIEALGGGFPYPEPTPIASPESIQPNSNNSVPWAAYIVVVCVAVAIPTVLVALALKKRSK
ncbi:MAG: hypothetical protein NWE95_03645 [Candidatus Bathyarchaeota archaeon]|nr:hypothetical protein [Candidatus Bathyarchaeota archaeon]